MRGVSSRRGFLFAVLLLVAFTAAPGAQQPGPPLPQPDPGPEPNIFYGAINPVANAKAPVLVFVHGLNGIASDWWDKSNMYQLAYAAGFRTAFVSLSIDNSRNNAGIEPNAAVLRLALRRISTRYGAPKMYLIGHSKGGIDLQAALLTPSTAQYAKAVFNISTPNQGTELADWAFEHPVVSLVFGLFNDGVAALRLAAMAQFRATADPVLRASGIPFYTLAGNVFYDTPGTAITGAILRSLTPNLTNDDFNDGLVVVSRTRLPGTYSTDLGAVGANHFATNSGDVSFSKIRSIIIGTELTFDEFERVGVDGLSEFGGDTHNTWAWSMKWFKGDLYVGTARENLCTSLLTSDVRTGTAVYPFSVLSTQCPDVPTLLGTLGAEIWRYTPSTKVWFRVFKSPDVIPTGFDDLGNATGFTARDVGFRGMAIHVEPDGTEALYVGSVTSGSVLERSPFEPDGYPVPRILRTVDGLNWSELPHDSGTFLHEIGNTLIDPVTKFRSIRSITSYKGKLFATIADFVGVGVVIASDDPVGGNDAWYYASPPVRSDLPVWDLKVFNGFLYATTGLTRDQDPEAQGYGVYKTDASGPPPYQWTPVIVNGGEQADPVFRAPNGLSMTVFKDHLYVGTNRPTELVRISADDSWELVVGEPRLTSAGFKAPISGLGNGFGSWFNGHLWRMTAHGDYLYVATWDWSVGIQGFALLGALDKLFSSNYGFDLYRSPDGVHWTAVTKNGLGDPLNSGGRSIESTPDGLFLGTARQKGGIQIFRSDGPAPAPAHLPPPTDLRARSELSVGRTVELQWSAVPGAVAYQVIQTLVKPIDGLFDSAGVTLAMPDGSTVTSTFSELMTGAYDALCAAAEGTPNQDACNALAQIRALEPAAETVPAAFPLPPRVVAVTPATTFTEPAPTIMQSLYFVRAQDADGNLSMPSNIVGGPSKAVDPDTPPVALCQDMTALAPWGRRAVALSVDAGSYPLTTGRVRITQKPSGPYPVGSTTVMLTISTRKATASCSALVTVTAAAPPQKPWRRGLHKHGGRLHYDDRCQLAGDPPEPSRARSRGGR